MKKGYKTVIIIVLSVIVVSNIPPVNKFFGFFFDQHHYRYSNGDGTWTVIENQFKGEHLRFEKTIPKEILYEKYPGADTIIYRLFWRNPLAFWRLGEYIYDKRYTIPYKSWKEIKKNRRIPGRENSSYQDF
jgi:hypothetical protein